MQKAIRRARKESKLTQAEIAEVIGWTRGKYSRLESGLSVTVTFDDLGKIVEAVGLKLMKEYK